MPEPQRSVNVYRRRKQNPWIPQILIQLRRQPRRLRPLFRASINKLPTLELNRCSNPLPPVAVSRDWIFQKLRMAEWYKAPMGNLFERCSLS
jgi:hypothetical protein